MGIMVSTYLFNVGNKVFNSLDPFSWYGSWISVKRRSKIKIAGKKLQGADSTRLHYSTNFFAVLYQIKKLNCTEASITELSEVPVEEPDNVSYDYDSDGEEVDDTSDAKEKTSRGTATNLIVSQVAPFQMTEDVMCSVNITKENEGNEKNPVKAEEFQMTLYSEFRFESGKTFDNVFYSQKKDIVKRLDFFTQNKAWYKKRGIPYTMGFMFYGDPGCGKTSTIKAIANHTQRHIVSVPLNKIKTVKELLNVFYNTRMNYVDIPLDKRLYVLEDIDAADLKDTVGERSEKDTENKEDSDQDSGNGGGINDEETQNFLNLLKGPKTKVGDFLKEKKQLTLAGILEVLDGVMEMDGRMLVITTNYPERLDAALIRPGRVDVKLKFGRCTNHCLVQMYEHFFNDRETSTLWPKTFERSQLPNDRWTPAEATQILLNNIHDPQQGLHQLSYEYPYTKNDLEDQ